MADGLLRSVYHGCIAGADADIHRRPYHKNCGCALCDGRNRQSLHAVSKHKTVSYPIRRAWSEGSLAMVAAASSTNSSPSSSSSVAEEDNIVWSNTRL